jgi:hypothetical protein
MPPTQELIDELFRDKVRQARATSPVDRFLDGARLFDYACLVTLAGIRHLHPTAGEADVKKILCNRIEIARQLEQQP